MVLHIQSMTPETVQALLTWKAAVVAAWIALLFAAERLAPAARPPAGDGRFGWRRLARNLALWGITTGMSILVVLPVSVWAAGVTIHPLADWRPGWWSGVPGLLLDLVVLDVLIYWWHRANHALPVLWRFHEVHHLDHFLDTTTALRFHFGEVLLSALARAAIIIVLDIPIASILVFEALVLVATVFHHSNLRLPPRLEALLAAAIITPSIHWVHHHAIRRDTDSNYGTVLSIWDRLFGSASTTRRSTGMAIGVEGLGDLPLTTLVVRPFADRRD